MSAWSRSVYYDAPTLRFGCTIRFCVSYAFARNIVGRNIIYEFSFCSPRRFAREH